MTYKHDDIQDGGIACDTSISSKKIYKTWKKNAKKKKPTTKEGGCGPYIETK